MDYELIELIHGPEGHLPGVLLSHRPGQAGRICAEAVVFAGVVEDRRKLVVDRLRVGRRYLLGQYLRLPVAHVGRCDLVQLEVPEKREYPVLEEIFLVLHGALLEPWPHVLEVNLQEGPEGHVAAPGPDLEKFILEGQGVLLALEAALLLEPPLPLPVCVVEGRVPGIPQFVFIGRNRNRLPMVDEFNATRGPGWPRTRERRPGHILSPVQPCGALTGSERPGRRKLPKSEEVTPKPDYHSLRARARTGEDHHHCLFKFIRPLFIYGF